MCYISVCFKQAHLLSARNIMERGYSMLMVILEALLLTSALSLDALVASFSYGINKIKIPIRSAMIINLICTGLLTASLFLGMALSTVISPVTAKIISCTVLIIIGLMKLFDSLIKKRIKSNKPIDRDIKFKFLSLTFIVKVFAEPEKADFDESKTLSIKEAVPLAIALSIDSLAAGFGAGIVSANVWFIIGFSLITDLFAIYGGSAIGRKIAKVSSVNLSWLSGVILIALAVSKIFL